jgi:hypothetical protein
MTGGKKVVVTPWRECTIVICSLLKKAASDRFPPMSDENGQPAHSLPVGETLSLTQEERSTALQSHEDRENDPQREV